MFADHILSSLIKFLWASSAAVSISSVFLKYLSMFSWASWALADVPQH